MKLHKCIEKDCRKLCGLNRISRICPSCEGRMSHIWVDTLALGWLDLNVIHNGSTDLCYAMVKGLSADLVPIGQCNSEVSTFLEWIYVDGKAISNADMNSILGL